MEIVRSFVKDPERPFKLRPSLLLPLHSAALDGIHPLAGTYRNGPVKIGGSLARQSERRASDFPEHSR
jgi:hypothetical protein